jgi:hypothetical protein
MHSRTHDPAHMVENLSIFDFELNMQGMSTLAYLLLSIGFKSIKLDVSHEINLSLTREHTQVSGRFSVGTKCILPTLVT